MRDLGCSVEGLRYWLEKHFEPGMSWGNYGPKGWHIDHIKPLSKHDLSSPVQAKEACHFTNLEPKWALDNMAKGNRGEF